MSEQKTFTQDEVNRIVSERLQREKEKSGASLDEREKDLAKREFNLKAKEILDQKKLPHTLLEALNTESEEAFNKSLEVLEQCISDKLKGDKITGTEPGGTVRVNSGGAHGSGGSSEDGSIRKAMGLSR